MMAGILLAEPAAAGALRRLVAGAATAERWTPSLLAVRLGVPLRRDDGCDPDRARPEVRAELGALFTVAPGVGGRAAAAVVRGDWDLAEAVAVPARRAARPGPLAAPLHASPSRDAGPASRRRSTSARRRSSRSRSRSSSSTSRSSRRCCRCGADRRRRLPARQRRARPEHVKRIGLVLALVATLVFATRDNLVRWLGPRQRRRAGCRRRATARLVTLRPRRSRRRSRVDAWRSAGGLCFGLSYVSCSRRSTGAACPSSRRSSRPSRSGACVSWLVLRSRSGRPRLSRARRSSSRAAS